MECGKSLSLPKDIPWKRLAYSVDMVDELMDASLPPKWRSSVAVFYYEVPEEETAEDYPERRIIFLKASATVTGFNLVESAYQEREISRITSILDGSELSTWVALRASGWREYYPCYGGILQVSIYPHTQDLEGLVSIDEFTLPNISLENLPEVLKKTPYIMDFEPKKREVFEARTESGEFLAGSSSKLNTGKSHTDTHSVSAEVTGGFGAEGGASVEASVGYQYASQDVTYTNKDWSREKRESFSHSTSLNQIYSIFDGYHLGTNRAMFVVQPRPHMVDSDFNLIDGIRRLEGIQDVFLVVSIPKENKGFCVQAHLDTGHIADLSKYIPMIKKDSELSTPEDYARTADIIKIPNYKRDLFLEYTVAWFNYKNGYSHILDIVDYIDCVSYPHDCIVYYRNEELFRYSESDHDYVDRKMGAEATYLKTRIFGGSGEDVVTEKLYVSYEKGSIRHEHRMFMTRRTVQNCALFNEDTLSYIPGVVAAYPAEEAGPNFSFEKTLTEAPASGTFSDLQDKDKKSELVHNYNKLSNQTMRNMVNAYSSSKFKPKGVPLTETEMFKSSMIRKIVDMPDYHPANIELSKVKGIDKKTLKELEGAGIKRIKDIFAPKPARYVKETKVPYETISDLQNKILGVKPPEKLKEDMKQQSKKKSSRSKK